MVSRIPLINLWEATVPEINSHMTVVNMTLHPPVFIFHFVYSQLVAPLFLCHGE